MNHGEHIDSVRQNPINNTVGLLEDLAYVLRRIFRDYRPGVRQIRDEADSRLAPIAA